MTIKIIMGIIKIIHIFWENLIKEDSIEQDFQRNYSERYIYSKRL